MAILKISACECGHVSWAHWDKGSTAQCAHCVCTKVQTEYLVWCARFKRDNTHLFDFDRDRFSTDKVDTNKKDPNMANDITEMSTPALVREFTEHKMADARGEVRTYGEHSRLGRVVTELRLRNVLD